MRLSVNKLHTKVDNCNLLLTELPNSQFIAARRLVSLIMAGAGNAGAAIFMKESFMTELKKILSSPVNRRAFLTRMSAAGLGIAAASLLASPAFATGQPVLEIVNMPDNGHMPGIPGRTKNEQVLNYALSLEILEADLYRQALNLAAGKPLETPLPDDPSAYTLSIDSGGLSEKNAARGFRYLQEFAAVEAAHRDFLHAAIQSGSGNPVGPNPGGYHAPFGSDLRSILTLIRTVEETGVRAYLGAAQFITGFTLTQTAAEIYSTEARHSAALNYILGLDAGPQKQRLDSQAVIHAYGGNNFEYFQTPEQVLIAVKPFLA